LSTLHQLSSSQPNSKELNSIYNRKFCSLLHAPESQPFSFDVIIVPPSLEYDLMAVTTSCTFHPGNKIALDGFSAAIPWLEAFSTS
jgi:hypothetical protein